MAFQEKSAWVMLVALLLAGAGYFALVAWLSAQMGGLAPPLAPALVVYVVALIAIAIVGHIVVAAGAPREANASLDERERFIEARASHRSGTVLGGAVILSLGLYLTTVDGNVLFYSVLASLMLSQILEYGLQIALHRASGLG